MVCDDAPRLRELREQDRRRFPREMDGLPRQLRRRSFHEFRDGEGRGGRIPEHEKRREGRGFREAFMVGACGTAAAPRLGKACHALRVAGRISEGAPPDERGAMRPLSVPLRGLITTTPGNRSALRGLGGRSAPTRPRAPPHCRKTPTIQRCPMNVFLYARKSTDEDDRQLLSIDAQLAELREFARKESLHIAREFVESRTAKVPGRPVFDAMMRDVERGHVEGILAWHPDRLARNSVDGGRIIYALDTGNMNALKFPTFWFENTPQGKFMLQIAFGQSKYYVDNLSENVKRGIRQKIRLGWFPSKPPVGYLNEPRLRTIVIDTDRAPLVRKLFEAYATDQYTIYQLRDLSERLGLVSRSGRPMFASRIPVILADQFYLGKFRLKGELHDGAHEPIISRDLFDRVQIILTRRSRKVAPRDPNDFAFLGMVHCASCGATITAERQKGHHYYRCTKKISPCPEKKYLREEKLETRFRAGLDAVSIDDEWAGLMLAEVERMRDAEKDAHREQVQHAEDRLSALDARQARLVDLHLDGGISREDYLSRRERIMQERGALAAQVAKMKAEGTGRLEPLAAFISDARQAHYVAHHGDMRELRDFHRKIGSNLF